VSRGRIARTAHCALRAMQFIALAHGILNT
jgi:hypothetical protein